MKRIYWLSLWIVLVLIVALSGAAESERLGYISGLVLDGSGNRVEGALIFALEQPVETESVNEAAEDLSFGSALTDATGSYEIAVPAGQYEVSATKDGLVAAPQWIVVGDGEFVWMEPFLLTRGARISGTLLLADGLSPLEGGVVAVSSNDAIVKTCTSDAAGHFEVTGLSGGEYTVDAYAEGMLFLETVTVSVLEGDSMEGVDLVATDMLVPDPSSLETGGISGRVLHAESGSPVADAVIGFAYKSDLYAVIELAWTDESGSFYEDYLPTGTHTLTAMREGLPIIYREGVILREGEMTEVADFLLPTSAGEITGTVTSAEDGSPVMDAFVAALSEDSFQTGFTDSDGAFTLPHLPAGIFEVTILADGFDPLGIDGISIQAGAVTLAIDVDLEVSDDES